MTEEKKAEITKMAQASWYDKIFNSGLSPTVRKVLEDKEKEHKEENEEFTKLTDPSIESACVTDDGTVVLLVTYEQLYNYSKELNFIFVYEKGKAKKLHQNTTYVADFCHLH